MSVKQDPRNVLSRVSYLFHPLWYLGLSNGDVVDRSECLTMNSQLSMNRLQYLLSWSHCIGYWDICNCSCWNVGRTGIFATGYQLLIPTSGVCRSPGSSVLLPFWRACMSKHNELTSCHFVNPNWNQYWIEGRVVTWFEYWAAQLPPLGHCSVVAYQVSTGSSRVSDRGAGTYFQECDFRGVLPLNKQVWI